MDCLRRKVEGLKARIKDLKAEVEKRAQIHEAAITNIQSKDQIIANYQDKAKRCSHTLEVMVEAGTLRTWWSTFSRINY